MIEDGAARDLFPIPERTVQTGPHYIALLDGPPGSALTWGGRFKPDLGTAMSARFETPGAALTAGRAARGETGLEDTNSVIAGIWPTIGSAHRANAAWWIVGEGWGDDEGQVGPGNWPFMVCLTNPHSGAWETVCAGIQNPAVAHLIAAAPDLHAALWQAVDALRLAWPELRPQPGTPPSVITAIGAALAAAHGALATAAGRAGSAANCPSQQDLD